MDEMDLIQDATAAAQEAMLEERRRLSDLEKKAVPPVHRDCADCGIDIPAARLKLKPLARFCVDCQEEQERLRR